MKTASSKDSKRTARAATVDAYLATLPEDARTTLAALRKTIRAAAPKATEVISYQIPTFKHQGMLVAFAAFEGHCGFYVISEKVLRSHAAELKEYELNKASIRFSTSKPLPAALVTKLVKARIAENEARQRGKTARPDIRLSGRQLLQEIGKASCFILQPRRAGHI